MKNMSYIDQITCYNGDILKIVSETLINKGFLVITLEESKPHYTIEVCKEITMKS